MAETSPVEWRADRNRHTGHQKLLFLQSLDAIGPLPVYQASRHGHCFPHQRLPTQSTHHAACYSQGNKISFTRRAVVSASNTYGHGISTILRSEEQPGSQSWAKRRPTRLAASTTKTNSFRELPIRLCIPESAWRIISSFFGSPSRRL